MNTKSLIGKMPQIAHLGLEEQSNLLEKARYEAFVHMGLAGKATLYLILCILGGFLSGITPSIILGFHVVTSSVSIGIGILISLYVYNILYKRLIQEGLEKVLRTEST